MQDFFVSKATNMRQLLSNHGLVWGRFHMARRGENIRKRKMVVGRVDISRAASLIEQQFGDMYTDTVTPK